ncbi:MAG: hypothetical protein DMG65_20695 [Candidatus Angelobacter sp. Gp1-AA117]|nr:MAG: hypothetical protein DMG65_20695 [Candidatus Angelobacter sp. Gp1-AA117]
MKKYICALSLTIFLLSCNSQNFKPADGPHSSEPPASQPASAPPVTVDKSTAGMITGTVSFQGAAPKLPPLDMTQDPGCPSSPQTSDAVVVKNGKLANVFVYIKDGLPQGSFSPSPEPAVLDQKGCRYVPHVLGLMVGQPLKVLNDDNAEHNVHPMPRENSEWNESQMPHGQPITKTFHKSEMMMPVQCNQHPWMKMYVNVIPNPYFAVSADNGTFEIKDLPPGEYTLAAVHEKFGEQTMKIKVGAKQAAQANFSFTAR